MLWLEHVTKHYGRRRVLDDANATFAKGSFTLLTGPNGAGKTTVLRLLSTYATPNAGTIHWVAPDGTELRDPAHVRACIGYAGHTPLAWDELTVRENLELQLRLRRQSTRTVDDWSAQFGLERRTGERADTLSRGMRQRLALAMATIHRPDFLLLDEPASNLDEQGLQRLRQTLEGFRTASTIVVATHEPERLRGLADREIRVHEGRLETIGASL